MHHPQFHAPQPVSAASLLAEAEQFKPGRMDHDYRIAAAWKLAQMAAGIPSCDWTPPPADFGPHYLAPQQRIAAE